MPLSVEEYTVNSVVVRGDTKEVKDKLKFMGGRWNASLTDRISGDKFGGWIFPKSCKSRLLEWVDQGSPQPTEVLVARNENLVPRSTTSTTTSNPSIEEMQAKIVYLTAKVARLEAALLAASKPAESVESEEETIPAGRLLSRN